jgi:hypothetical protein
LELLFNQCRPAFKNEQAWQKARELVFGTLTCMGRHTVAGMLTASGQQYIDWSSAYRLFSRNRIDIQMIFAEIIKEAIKELEPFSDIVISLDDTILKKTGRKVPGTAWRRDPLGPKFSTNFIWGQRFLQVSMAMPESGNNSRSRGVPIMFKHCPTVKKPGKNAGEGEKQVYHEEKKKQKLSLKGSESLNEIRRTLDQQGFNERILYANVDGSYTNKEVLKNMPERTTLTGRIRKDTKLNSLPESSLKVGRKRVYGQRLPTPEEVRQSDKYKWEEVKAWAAGKTHNFNVKIIKNVRWTSAGEKHILQLVVIRPLGYRLTKSSKLLYREPAYLICTDNDLKIEKLLQAYLWRWEIEVNFREEKTLLGCGQAQIRNPFSVESVPAFVVAIYGMLHLAAKRSAKIDDTLIPRSLWYPKKHGKRTTTGDIINNVRTQLYCRAIDINFSGFVSNENCLRSLRNKAVHWTSATFFSRN